MARFELTELTGGNGPFVAGTAFDLAAVGYTQVEYAVTATVRAFGATAADLVVVEEAEVCTRLLIHRPTDATRGNGTVVVEWLNVSAGLDASPVWLFTHRELIRTGATWIGVSAQQVGIQGGAGLLDMAAGLALQQVDPERYGDLRHPGDRFSYDLFSLVAEIARSGVVPALAGLPVERVLGLGESQSAFRLTTYLNRLDHAARAYDGFLVHARGGTAAPLDDLADPLQLRDGEPVPFRVDLRVPVLCVQAETDLISLGYQAARQDDEEHLVVWEMAGTSHADVYTFAAGFADDGRQPIEDLARAWVPSRDLFGQHLDEAVNAGPQHYIMQAALRSLEQWVRDGTRPSRSDRLQVRGHDLVRDDLGNAMGGIRTPHVDVPVAALSGLGNGGGPIAFLAGTTRPFPREQLTDLYGTKAAFAERFTKAAAAAADAGFLLHDDLDEITAIAIHNVDLPA